MIESVNNERVKNIIKLKMQNIGMRRAYLL